MKKSNKEQTLGRGSALEVSSMQMTPKKSGTIFADKSICHGCGICELVCSLSHSGACDPALSNIRLLRDPLAGEFLIETCRQCDFPGCYFSCPYGAIVIEPKTGARVIDGERCEGCGSCSKACPFNERGTIVKPDPEKGIYLKCDLCMGLGRGPLCVEACPLCALSHIPAAER